MNNSNLNKGTLMKSFATSEGAMLMDVETFHMLITSGKYKSLVEAIRKAKENGQDASELKKKLPLYVCAGDVTKRRKLEDFGQATGLCPVDIDHIVAAEVTRVMEQAKQLKWIVEAHRSCSGSGVHLIVNMGVIEGHDLGSEQGRMGYALDFKKRYQAICRAVSNHLGVAVDEQCKDCLRGLFVSYDPEAWMMEDSVVFNEAAQAVKAPSAEVQATASAEVHSTASAEVQSSASAEVQSSASAEVQTTASDGTQPQVKGVGEMLTYYLSYHPYKPSSRHSWWIGLAQYLIYKGVPVMRMEECQKKMAMLLQAHDLVQADDPLLRSHSEVVEAMQWGATHSSKPAQEDSETTEQQVFDDREFREQLPPLPIGLKESVKGIPETVIMPVLCGLMPIAATYATHAKARYADGRMRRLNCMTIVTGGQGTNKSSVKYKLDIWKQQMRKSDSVALQVEDEFKKKRKHRKANEKLPEEPCEYVCEVPITTSNSALLKRLKNAHGKHLFSFGEELDTLVKTNGAGSWSQKYDVYRLAFDNGEWGQDYVSETAESGVVNVCYNWTVLGTEGALMRVFRKDNLENGMAGRLLLARMPSKPFEHMPDYVEETPAQVEAIQSAVEILSQASGELKVDALSRHMRSWSDAKVDDARAHNDLIQQTFQKRACIIGWTCGCIYYILEGKERVSQNCKQFATVMAEYALRNQCEVFGSMMLQNPVNTVDTSAYNSRGKCLYDELPVNFCWEDVEKLCPSSANYSAMRSQIYRWVKNGRVTKVGSNQWRKLGGQDGMVA